MAKKGIQGLRNGIVEGGWDMENESWSGAHRETIGEDDNYDPLWEASWL